MMLLVWSTIFASALAAIRLDVVRKPRVRKLNPERISPRATIYESLLNNITAGSYIASVTVGTPPQRVDLIVDTGSSDTWLLDSTADLCTRPSLQRFYADGCTTPFTSQNSSTIITDTFDDSAEFSISYADGSGAAGSFISDLFTIGNITLRAQLGLAYNTSITTGILGLGYTANEANGPFLVYPTILDLLVSSKFIPTSAYSLYLNDLSSSSGSILLGGIDTAKFYGNLTIIPAIPKSFANGTAFYSQFAVPLTELSITAQNGSITHLPISAEPVILDSGTTITYLPPSLTTPLFASLGAIDDTHSSGDVFIDCQLLKTSPNLTINYHFSSSTTPTIKVPLRELIFDFANPTFTLPANYQLPQNLPFSNPCGFGIQEGEEGSYLLGDTFLRSAYAVFDLETNEVGLAQTKFGQGAEGRVREFESGETGIESVRGVLVTDTAGVSATSKMTGMSSSSTVGVSVTPKTTGISGSSAVTVSTVESVTGCVTILGGATGGGSGCGTGALPPATSTGKSEAVSLSMSWRLEHLWTFVVVLGGMMLGGGFVMV
ncbi:hypothetical protein ACMFMF_009264 [Clarireedia jacksonii]